MDILEKLRDLPLPLRVCAGTDGSVTYLLELITRARAEVTGIEQNIKKADPKTSELLEIPVGSPVNERKVDLRARGKTYVHAVSLTPLERLPPRVKEDILGADIPIGKILRHHNLETRRDLLALETTTNPAFPGVPVVHRSYKIIHQGKPLIYIEETFPIDERWEINQIIFKPPGESTLPPRNNACSEGEGNIYD